MRKQAFGFTLMELLVVIAVIGILSSIALVFYSGTTAKGRDARRVKDIKTIQSALNLYINQNNTYPLCQTEESVSGCLSEEVPKSMISSIPNDLKNTGNGQCSGGGDAVFIYCYQSYEDATNYALWYHLETNSVGARGWHNVGP